ncbi:Methoxy mycolic acid synthase MmaA3 [Pseudobythopirellula maris]|uniref:Methoxy mycolic acid synthase MmaA3 n=1 Tax=Pseudobythopirellula maris TaxID=2527991 RepID=A0A5C5ZLC9_9BACT|nr:cyclopropane-fatty-acyl-phospholipid synthase family protein [Pseudobythopirellula maris]TWT88199.1 Methoxy mycolic acid synthase MmaA3 [Pseudobythopirellula maris]
MGHPFSADAQLRSAKRGLATLAAPLDMNVSVRLWDGSLTPLGAGADSKHTIELSGPGVIGALVRRPSLETLARLYATGHVSFEGGDLVDFTEAFRAGRSNSKRLKGLDWKSLLLGAVPFLFARPKQSEASRDFRDDMVGRVESRRNNTDYVRFHYDVSNEFYELFLGEEMVYTCAYFKEPGNSLDQAQRDKLDMICRKLRIEPGDRLLDIGCGWGALLCHAARHYGATAHGITLSQEQHDYTQAKIARLGLTDRVSVEICDYADHTGSYDKVCSVGMSEHIGVANYPRYFDKINSLLRDRGMVLNHAIARRSKRSRRSMRRIRPERKLLLKYIFPGSELTPVGMTTDFMEQSGFEIQDVESWREHYALTTRHWCQRLSANKERAIELVGPERYRLWVAYLAGAAAGFEAGSIKLFQVVATKHQGKGLSGMPPTREHLYRAA